MAQPAGATLEQLRIIWRALLASLAVYSALPLLLRPAGDAESTRVLLLALMAIAALTAIGTLVARERLLVGPIRSGELSLTTPEGQTRVSTLCITLWALSESIGLYGILLYALSGEARYLYLFLMASAGLFFAHRPGRWPASQKTPIG
jgi:hypothetical protein